MAEEGELVPHNETGSNGATGTNSPQGFIADGVRLGYQVIDAYLKQGQRVARQFVGTPSAVGTANGPGGEFEVRSAQLLTELMANWSDLIGVYTEALNSGAGSARPQGQSQDRASAPAASASSASAIQLAYEISSHRPALVDAEFFPGRETLDLASHGLRCLRSSEPEIAVAFEQDPERRRTIVSIHVPDDQPAGLYTGALLDSNDGSTVGGLSLRIR
jgi:hypothetical protein